MASRHADRGCCEDNGLSGDVGQVQRVRSGGAGLVTRLSHLTIHYYAERSAYASLVVLFQVDICRCLLIMRREEFLVLIQLRCGRKFTLEYHIIRATSIDIF